MRERDGNKSMEGRGDGVASMSASPQRSGAKCGCEQGDVTDGPGPAGVLPWLARGRQHEKNGSPLRSCRGLSVVGCGFLPVPVEFHVDPRAADFTSVVWVAFVAAVLAEPEGILRSDCPALRAPKGIAPIEIVEVSDIAQHCLVPVCARPNVRVGILPAPSPVTVKGGVTGPIGPAFAELGTWEKACQAGPSGLGCPLDWSRRALN